MLKIDFLGPVCLAETSFGGRTKFILKNVDDKTDCHIPLTFFLMFAGNTKRQELGMLQPAFLL